MDTPEPVNITVIDHGRTLSGAIAGVLWRPEYLVDEIRRLALELRMRHPTLRSLLIIGPSGGEGASTVASLYAAVLADMSGGAIGLVDANLRAPSLHKVFGISAAPGIREWDATQPHRGLHTVGRSRLSVMPAGHGGSTLLQVFNQSGRLDALGECMRRSFEMVVWDAPPQTLYPDATLLLPHIDGVLIVAEADATRTDVLCQVSEQLAMVGARVVGVVLNRTGRYFAGARPPQRGRARRSVALLGGPTD